MKLKKKFAGYEHPKTKVVHMCDLNNYDATLCGESFDSLDISKDGGYCFKEIKTDTVTCTKCIGILEKIKPFFI